MEAFLKNFLTAGQNGLQLIGTAVLPVLFPFFVLTSLIINLSHTNNRIIVVALSYFSGYPNGARLTQTLYRKGIISAKEAQHLSVITSTPSPIFVIATVGAIFLKNTELGLLIFLCAVGGALVNGIIWPRPATKPQFITTTSKPESNSFLKAFNQSFTSATNAIINVSGIVLFFYILAQLLNLPTYLAGLLEMTTGVAQTINPILIEFFICFGGLSVAVQNLLFAEDYQLKWYYYFAYKLTHAIIACGFLAVCLLLFN